MATFNNLNFDNQALKKLPIEESGDYLIQRPIRNACFSRVKPTPIENPVIVSTSSALNLIDLDPKELEREDAADYLCGNKYFDNSEYAAHCYCGHQFGQFAGQLGDGATMYIGEIVNKSGVRWEMQFKGAGKTPFSRTADGRKVLRSSIREYLCSEAMFHLGVPTTRAGSIITSFDTKVIRDKFYDGRNKFEPATVITRIAPTFIRFGSFEIIKEGGPSAGKTEIATQLADYVIDTVYQDIQKEDPDKYIKFIRHVSEYTAKMVVSWQLIGWCHGVLNTDNMSVAGITIDYGPFGFVDRFDPEFVCNASDNNGRYSYGNQPSICKWNLIKWRQMLSHLVPENESIDIIHDAFDKTFFKLIIEGARRKMGLFNEIEGDQDLYESLLQIMADTGADFTNTFRMLSNLVVTDEGVNQDSKKKLVEKIVSECCYTADECQATSAAGSNREIQMMKMMLQHGMLEPEQIERVREMINAHEVKANQFNMSNATKKEKDLDLWATWFEVYEIRLNKEKCNPGRKAMMDKNNPKYILRNHLLEKAIEAADDEDFSLVNDLLKLVQNPFDDVKLSEEPVLNYCKGPSIQDMVIKVT